MSDGERVLRSFVADEEDLLGIWPVSKASFSKGTIAPRHVSEQLIAVTDERVCWFDDELHEVALADLGRTDLDYVSQTAAAPMVMGGGLLFVLGVFGSIGAFFANVGDVFVVSMPALTGLAIFLGSRVVANATGREGETRAGYRLTLWTDDDEVAIWSEDEATMEAIDEAIAGVRDPDREVTSDADGHHAGGDVGATGNTSDSDGTSNSDDKSDSDDTSDSDARIDAGDDGEPTDVDDTNRE